ncbi:tetratricopeptide repeat protein [Chloroflexi bacterium TSY]|nr:tetratricopeptide repeat protein [Chloroflexi bacterium TSY]
MLDVSRFIHDMIETLLAFGSSLQRQVWIRQHFPTKDNQFVTTLHAESSRLERDDPRKALLISEIVMDAATVWDDQETQIIAILIEANARRLQGALQSALELYERATSQYIALGLELEAARAAIGQIDTMMYLGQNEAALSLAVWVIRKLREDGDQLRVARTIMNQGNIFARLGRYQEANHCYDEARSIFDLLNETHYLAMAEANQANVLADLDDFRQAEKMYVLARTRFKNLEMTSAVAQIDHNLACVYFAQGDIQAALTTFNRARDVLIDQDSQIDVAYIDLYRSEIYLALNLWDVALDLARKARLIFEEANMPWETARLWLNEATSLAQTADSSTAIEALLQARNLFAQEQNDVWKAMTYLYQATLETDQEQFLSAQEHALQSQEIFAQIGMRSRIAQCAVVLGNIAFLSNNILAASNHFMQALEHLEGINFPEIGVVHFRRTIRFTFLQREKMFIFSTLSHAQAENDLI